MNMNQMLAASGVDTFLTVMIIILLVVAAIFVGLYFLGRKMQKRQSEQKQQMDAVAQTVSMLVIDKKKMRLKECTSLPKQVLEQTPKYLRRAKMPIVKAKVGPRVMTLMSDPQVFEQLPVKQEVKVVVSGLYITSIKSVRGGAVPAAPKKKGIFSKLRRKAQNKMNEMNQPDKKSKKKK
ncbi:hypothetical protein [Cuneatibacter caecimuris]|uniref:Uncharacterized protein n=1 Tax=Cuneatibacter caecimuris TaxID=1796618 RepID=A0A4Q7PK74_9FIRM|nr:hypothetical protein [Cuneatibacter caecimuris]RZT00459.1 hypothetical protein EV209_1770 [Cuneatibacter caecimuris]